MLCVHLAHTHLSVDFSACHIVWFASGCVPTYNGIRGNVAITTLYPFEGCGGRAHGCVNEKLVLRVLVFLAAIRNKDMLVGPGCLSGDNLTLMVAAPNITVGACHNCICGNRAGRSFLPGQSHSEVRQTYKTLASSIRKGSNES